MADSPLQINPENASYLQETARWATFLSIVGFVAIGFIVLVVLPLSLGTIRFGWPTGGGVGLLLILLCVAAAACYFFSCLYLYRFASKLRRSLVVQNQTTLDAAFKNLRSSVKFVGSLVIIALGFCGMLLVLALLSGVGSAIPN